MSLSHGKVDMLISELSVECNAGLNIGAQTEKRTTLTLLSFARLGYLDHGCLRYSRYDSGYSARDERKSV